jgi:RNA polymerase sigma-70 factor, ECF subfamily
MEEREESSHQQIAAASEHRPDAELLQEELRQAVDAAIAALPESQRMAVILRRYEGMPYEEIAEVLGLSVSAVKSLLFRARTTLRDALQDFLDA